MQLVLHAVTGIVGETTEVSTQPLFAIFFGAGNCNDLDIPQLLQHFHGISMVDIDNVTVQEGVNRQTVNGDEMDTNRVLVHPSIDLSGTLRYTHDWVQAYRMEPPQEVFQTALGTVQQLPTTEDFLRLPHAWAGLRQKGAQVSGADQGYDVAVSLCLLSQFGDSLGKVLSESKRQTDLLSLILAVRRRHLHQMIQSLRPGGHGTLVVDMVSMKTLPQLLQTNDGDDVMLDMLARRAEQQGNFFHGTNRHALLGAIQRDFGHAVDDVQLHPPWKWTIAEKRQYLVYSVTFRRRTQYLSR